LLFCFLAPLLFISIAQFTVVTNKWNKAHQESPEKPVVAPMHPIDRALGAPVPDTPEADGSGDAKKPSPTPAYVFAGIFAALYLIILASDRRRRRHSRPPAEPSP